MFHIFEDEDFIQCKISTDIQHINPLIQQFSKFLQQYRDRDEESVIRIIRELLNNAIEHGNRNIRDLTIIASLEKLENNHLRIVVEDEGSGFDYEKNGMNIPDNSEKNHKQGLEVVKALSDKMVFSEKGRCVTVYVGTLPRKEFEVHSFTGEDGNSWELIRPAGNITSENARKFRKELLDLFYAGQRRFRFDFTVADDIDSVGLSIMIKFSNLICEKYADAQMEIVNANRDIVNLMRMTRMNQIYRII